MVKLQRPPPEIAIFRPTRALCSSSATRRPRRPAVKAHINPAAPPPQTKVDTSNPLFQERWAKVRQYGIDLMRQSLQRDGLGGQFKVLDKDISAGDIGKLVGGVKP